VRGTSRREEGMKAIEAAGIQPVLADPESPATVLDLVGDVAAVRLPGVDLIVPPTPPPDIDIETWEDSIGIVEGWNPERLALTHFGAIEDPAPHLARTRERLREEAQLARELSEDDYEKRHRELVTERADSPDAAAELIQCVPPEYQWRGLDRYWRKREERLAAG